MDEQRNKRSRTRTISSKQTYRVPRYLWQQPCKDSCSLQQYPMRLRLVSASSWSPHLTVAVWIEFLYILYVSLKPPNSRLTVRSLWFREPDWWKICCEFHFLFQCLTYSGGREPWHVPSPLSNSRSYSSQHILLHSSRTRFVGQLSPPPDSVNTLFFSATIAVSINHCSFGSWALGLQTLSHTVPSLDELKICGISVTCRQLIQGSFFMCHLQFVAHHDWLSGSWQHSALRLLGGGCVHKGRDGRRRTYKDKGPLGGSLVFPLL